MTTVASPSHPDMDLLRADDQMDLASSPAMQTEDVELDLDDVREGSAQPNHDLMLQDEPEQPTADSDPMRSTISDHVDDDLMLDEDTVIQHEDRAEIPEMNMHQEYEHAQDDPDDDILYEDEEDLQDEDGLPSVSLQEQQMQDEHRPEDQQIIDEVQIGEDVEDQVKAEGGMNFVPVESAQEAEEINDPSGQPQSSTAAAAGESDEGVAASSVIGANLLPEPQSDAKALENPSEKIFDQNTIEKHDEADFDIGSNEKPESNDNATIGHSSDVDGSKAIKSLSEHQESGSDPGANPQTNINAVQEESVTETTLTTPVLPTVKVHYLGTDMCLFPPTHDEVTAVYFLEDASLAHESLDKMLGACREVLSGSIGEDDELVLDVASLGLHISEGSRYATQLTLSQILDVYVALAHNDNVTSIEPLHCSLSTRVCLESQYAYLQSAANEGRTFTEILEENAFTPDDDPDNGLEHAETKTHGQQDSAEVTEPSNPTGDNQEQDAGSNSQDAALKSDIVDTQANSATEDHSQAFEQQQQQTNEDEPALTGGPSKETELQDDGRSLTSTAKGDSDEIEGEYDLSLDLCLKPDACLCSSCANTNPDTHVKLAGMHDNMEYPADTADETAQNAEGSEQVHSDGLAGTEHGNEPDFEGNFQDSASSRTLEAENNQLEEDRNSSYDPDPQSDDGHDEFDIRYDDGEEFDLEEEIHQNAGAEVDDNQATDLHYVSEHAELDLEHIAPTLAHDVINENGINSASHQDNEDNENGQDPAQPEDDDDLLSFDDGETGNGEKEEDQKASFSTHPLEVPSSQNTNNDATKAQHNGISYLENGPSSGALKSSNAESAAQDPTGNTSTNTQEDAPTTPSGGKKRSKRKTFEDEEEFDLLDTATPEKKRRRPSP